MRRLFFLTFPGTGSERPILLRLDVFLRTYEML